MTLARPTIRFRMAGPGDGASAAQTDLAEELQRRLRLLQVIGLPVIALILLSQLAAFRRAGVKNPFAAVWALNGTPEILVGLVGSVVLFTILAPQRRWSMRGLRVIEAYVIAASFVGMIRIVLADIPGSIAEGSLSLAPVNTAFAHTGRFAVLIVGFAVLLPATRRHAIMRTAAMVIGAALPPLIVLPRYPTAVPQIEAYIGSYIAMLLTWAVLAMYGAYRIAVFREDASEARRLGQYVLRDRIGTGGMGEVYRAEHRFLRRPCAVKLIRPEQAGDAASLARFEREVQATAALAHPGIVQIYDYGRADDGTFYYVMEYLEGRPLDRVVGEEGALAPARAVEILRQLCDALGEAHERGLIHRDLKPSNVLLGPRGRRADVAKLLDFGLVATAHDGDATPERSDATRLTQAGTIVGTPEYMSPEQCGGEERVGVESDIYSLAALGYFLMSGRSPFAGRGAVQMLVAHMHEVPVPLHEVRPEVPLALSAVIARALAKSPADRYPTADAFAEALGQHRAFGEQLSREQAALRA
jgi:tRNA A-37 threonylcarbamoyl transferase component Bud32